MGLDWDRVAREQKYERGVKSYNLFLEELRPPPLKSRQKPHPSLLRRVVYSGRGWQSLEPDTRVGLVRWVSGGWRPLRQGISSLLTDAHPLIISGEEMWMLALAEPLRLRARLESRAQALEVSFLDPVETENPGFWAEGYASDPWKLSGIINRLLTGVWDMMNPLDLVIVPAEPLPTYGKILAAFSAHHCRVLPAEDV